MSKKRHISFWLTEEDMNGYQCQILMPVIFCKDCKYFMYGNGCILQGVDYSWEEQMYADDFCSRGEKR